MSDQVTKRTVWPSKETAKLIALIRELNIVQAMDGSRRNSVIFSKLHKASQAAGIDKSTSQLRTKYKALKSQYLQCVRENSISRNARRECEFFQELGELFGHRPAATIDLGVGSIPDGELSNSNTSTTVALNQIENSSGAEVLPDVSDQVRDDEIGISKKVHLSTTSTPTSPQEFASNVIDDETIVDSPAIDQPSSSTTDSTQANESTTSSSAHSRRPIRRSSSASFGLRILEQLKEMEKEERVERRKEMEEFMNKMLDGFGSIMDRSVRTLSKALQRRAVYPPPFFRS